MLMLRKMDETAIRLLYESSLVRDFPASELKSLASILALQRRGEYDVLGAYQDEKLVAYALIYSPKGERIGLLDYLAVEPECRRQGVGSALLYELRAHYAGTADVLMIECERPKAAPDEAEARKRIRFYTRAGAALTSVRIWLFGVEYSILYMSCCDELAKTDWAERMLGLYRGMLPEDLYARNVRLIQS